jgi:hypothetical protein
VPIRDGDHPHLPHLLRRPHARRDSIRDCFAWREIAPLPTSILLRPHTLQDCGLRASHLADGMTRAVFTDLEFARLAAMPNLRASNAQVQLVDQRP